MPCEDLLLEIASFPVFRNVEKALKLYDETNHGIDSKEKKENSNI